MLLLGAGIGATAGVAGKMKLEKINSIKKLKMLLMLE